MIKVGINGCGRVGKALLEHWILLEFPLKVIFVRTSSKQWTCESGLSIETLQNIIEGGESADDYTDDLLSILESNPIDYLFELTPTDLATASISLDTMMKVLEQGVSIIFANKGPVLKDYQSLKTKADEMNVGLGLSAVMGASLPSYALLRFGSMGSNVLEMKGILNGTTNYLLSMMETGKPFIDCIERAVDEGIAETNYAYDVDGIDAAVKMSILASVLQGRNINYQREDVSGIRSVSFSDFKEAENNNSRLKLIARYKEGKVTVSVEEVPFDDIYYHVNGAEKILTLKTDYLSEMSVVGGKSGLKEVSASLHRDLLVLEDMRAR